MQKLSLAGGFGLSAEPFLLDSAFRIAEQRMDGIIADISG